MRNQFIIFVYQNMLFLHTPFYYSYVTDLEERVIKFAAEQQYILNPFILDTL
jgi:hypothetical protein